FCAVAQTLNVSRAAEHLSLAQSTVSQRLSVLEEEIGVALFERGKGVKAIRLTSAGEKFIDIAERWASLRRDILLLPMEKQFTLSVGIINSLNFYAGFPALFQALIQHRPKIRLQVVTKHSAEMYDVVERRQVEVAFTLVERIHASINVEQCYSEPMVVIRLSSGEEPPVSIHPLDLNPDYELYAPWSQSYQIWHDRWWNHLSFSRVWVDTAHLMLNLLHDPRQWAIVPLSVGQKAAAGGGVAISRLLEAPPARVVYKITHKRPKPATVDSLKVFDRYFKELVASQDDASLPGVTGDEPGRD
ncbi:MAG TPA: LysR family transcriptional regulator, partial [Negativicutes bacterium]|nr:LysR family transcriptional regulator [Negativicutes bacterium]